MTAKEITSRIKDPEAVVLLEGWVLVEAIKKESKILSPDADNPHNIDYWKIVKIEGDNKDLKVGDVVLNFDLYQQVDFECKDRVLRILPAIHCRLVVRADNFDKDYKEGYKPNLLIN